MDITCLDDVLPWIAGRRDFVVKRATEYVAVDYQVALPDTFADERRIELRGIKFHPDGRIMARPLHKFFNLGERPVEIDITSPHVITDKLDGSMVHPAILPDGDVRLMTRMGLTNVAAMAERHLTDVARTCLGKLLMDGCTPILEFTAPNNRIVIAYSEPRLTLVAVRHTVTGQYEPRDSLESIAGKIGVPVVRSWGCRFSEGLVEQVKSLRGHEGVVVQFASGLWLKIKATEYVAMHRAKDGIAHEKNVIAAIVDGIQDDIKPLLPDIDRARLENYERAVLASLFAASEQVERVVVSGAELSQREFATIHLDGLPDWLRSCAFSVRAGKASAIESVGQYIRKRCGTQAEVDSVREIIGATWQVQ